LSEELSEKFRVEGLGKYREDAKCCASTANERGEN